MTSYRRIRRRFRARLDRAIHRQDEMLNERVHQAFERDPDAITIHISRTAEELKSDHEIVGEVTRLTGELEAFESFVLLKRARRLAIEIPTSQQRASWWSSGDKDGTPAEWLSEEGRTGVKKLIILEKRANIEWWLTKIILPVLQALVPIIALLLGILSVFKK